MRVNFVAKNASNFIELNAAFFMVESGRGLTENQLISLLSKMKDSKEYELMTVEGDGVSAMGLINIIWFEKYFGFDAKKIEHFVTKVIEKIDKGIYEESEDGIYYLKKCPIYIASPDVY